MANCYKCMTGRKIIHLLKFFIAVTAASSLISYFVYEYQIKYSFESIITTTISSYRRFDEMFDINNTLKYSNYTYEFFSQWTQTLCSERSSRRGPHQKIIAISVYGTASKFTDNSMFAWNTTIMPFLKQLTQEVNDLLPSWVIRMYTDYVGSTVEQRELIKTYANVDVCDMNNLPIFGSLLLSYMPGKTWRFLPVLDPYVDYTLSRDLDSPIIRRETETLDLWLSSEHENNFFYIARDHPLHDIYILGGLWGAAPVRARRVLSNIFLPILTPTVARQYTGAGDQQFLGDFVRKHIMNNSLIFDSFHCAKMNGRPFLSQRLNIYCFLGCIRPCCENITLSRDASHVSSCPLQCRPLEHQTWEFC